MRVRDQLILHDVVYGHVIRKTFNDAFLIINVCYSGLQLRSKIPYTVVPYCSVPDHGKTAHVHLVITS